MSIYVFIVHLDIWITVVTCFPLQSPGIAGAFAVFCRRDGANIGIGFFQAVLHLMDLYFLWVEDDCIDFICAMPSPVYPYNAIAPIQGALADVVSGDCEGCLLQLGQGFCNGKTEGDSQAEEQYRYNSCVSIHRRTPFYR
ncbi:MAG: hypothetical protein OEL83_06290 [Desulforhopalus sp.]|nr:hypothetical protein [Desulforhopalus sp.]